MTVVGTYFAIGRGFLSACGRTDDVGDTVIGYVSLRHVTVTSPAVTLNVCHESEPDDEGTGVYGSTTNRI